jgi:UDP-N-acetylmuramyl pentapeptide phosphotransferase/UDP-N-acetylglucosamine-1-phosphate transferase
MQVILSAAFLFFFLMLFIFLKKEKKYLDNINLYKHKKITTQKKVPLLGGLYLISIYILFVEFPNSHILLFISLLFLIGTFSDFDLLKNPITRFIIQILIILCFFYISELRIISTRVKFLDEFLLNEIFSLFFFCFCVLILINGFNFIDGVNGLAIGYFLLLLFTIELVLPTNLSKTLLLGDLNLKILLFILFFLIIFEFIFLGDSGSYLLGFLSAITIININYDNQEISPFFLILLIWYPCYEILFSFVRKIFINRKSVLYPDANHLHQLLFKFFKSKKVKFSNTFSSLIILFYIALNFYISSYFVYSSQYSILLILFNVIIYNIIYINLYNDFKT